jgi:hypothetical protein
MRRSDRLKPDGTVCAGTISVLFVLALLFTPFPTVSAGDHQTDYVQYVIVENIGTVITVIEGTIVDSELGTPVGGAGVGGEVRSDIIYVNVQADENGRFRVSLPKNLADENHTFTFNVSSPGYDNKLVVGTLMRGETKNLGQIRINYNPFDVQLAENSGSLTRGWTPYAYDNHWSTSGKWSSWHYYADYGGERSSSSDPQPTVSSALNSALQSAYDSASPIRGETSRPGRFIDGCRLAVQNILLNATGGPVADILKNWGGSLARISYEYTAQKWKYVYRYYTDGWHSVTLDEYRGSGFWDWVYIKDPWTRGGYWKSVWFSFNYYYSAGPTNDWRTYGWVQYERKWYGYITTYYTSRTNDYLTLPWDNVQTTVTVTPKNGYTGGVKLALEFDNGITAGLGKNELTFASPASTTLTLKPKDDTHGSLHPVTIRAYDTVRSTPFVRTKSYDLSLTTLAKPDVSTVITSVVEVDTRIPPPVLGVHVGSLDGQVQGVSVGIYTETLVGNQVGPGSLLASGVTDSKGVANFTNLPYNTALHVLASKPGYFTGRAYATYTQGGRTVRVDITKGSYDVQWVKDGIIKVYPSGAEIGNTPGKAKVATGGWCGGSISMSGVLSEYFGSYRLSPGSVNITQGEQPVEVKAHSNSRTPTISVTSCAVDVYGKAWVYTARHAPVGYNVELWSK